MATTEIATIDVGAYLALNHSTAEIQSIVADNLAGQDVGEFDLPRVVMPAGGGTRWEIPSIAGNDSAEELSGILVYHKHTRAYWKDDQATGSPPDCSSRDNVVGLGNPGGECRVCPLAQFGSDGKAGRAQACKQQSMWFLLREDSFLPIVVGLAPTSLKAAKQYLLSLAGAGIRFNQVVTTLRLEADKNADGQKYSRAVPVLGGKLAPETADRAREYADLLRPIFDAQAAAPAAATAEPVPGAAGPVAASTTGV